MYTIIGGDGKEYGPVPTDQILAWIAAGRASPDTRAKALGTEEWKRLGDFPAFGGSGGEPPPVETGAIAGDTDEAIAAGLIARSGKLDIGFCYERSWSLLKANFWSLVGATFLVMAASMALSFIPHFGMPANILLAGAFNGGLYRFFLLKIRGQPAGVSDAFSGFGPAFIPLTFTGLVAGALTILGLLALVIPGIYLAVSYVFIYMLVIDQKLGFWTAMEVSRRVVTAQWWRILGLLLLAFVFALLGCALLFIGIFITLPLIVGALAYAYEDLCRPSK